MLTSAGQHRFKDTFIDWLLGHCVLIMVVSLLLVLAMGYGANRLHLDTDWKIFFDKDDPNLIAEENLQNTYGKSDNILFIIAPDNANVFASSTLAAVEELTERAWQTPHSVRVDSITNYQYPLVEGDDILVENLVTDAADLNDRQIFRIRKIAVNDIGLANRLISPTGSVTAVNVTLSLPEKNSLAVNEAVQFAQQLRTEIKTQNPGLDIYLTGLAVTQQTFEDVAGRDAITLMPGMFILILILLAILFRSIFATLATLIVVVLSIIVGMGCAGWMGFALNNVNIAAPTIIMTLAVADSVHLVTTFLRNFRAGEVKKVALKKSLSLNLYPIFLTSITTALGFLTLNFSDSPPFRELGTISAVGVLGALWVTVLILPGLINYFPMSGKPIKEGSGWNMTRFADWVISHQNTLIVGVLAVTIVCAAGISRIHLNDDPIGYFSDNVPLRKASVFLEKNLSGNQSITYSLDSGEPGGVSDPEFLRSVDAFASWLGSLEQVKNIENFTDTLKRLNQVMHGDRTEEYRLPKSRELAAQLILMYELSLPYGLDLNNQINSDKSALRLTFTVTNLKSAGLIDLERKVSHWLTENSPSLRSRGASQSLMFANIGQRNIESMIAGSIVAFLLIFGLLMLALKSIRYGLISLVPNIFPAVVTFGVWGLLVGEINMAASVVFSLTLGIIVDDTIHFLSKYIAGRRELGLCAEDAVRYSFETVGAALIVTSIALAAGFMILALSDFVVNSTSGALVAGTIMVAIVLDLLFLPAILIKVDNFLHKDATPYQS